MKAIVLWVIIIIIGGTILVSGVIFEQADFTAGTQIPGVEGDFAVVATDHQGGVFVAYQSLWSQGDTPVESLHIFFSFSHDYGRSWSESYRISDNASSSVFCDSPSIAVDENSKVIYVAWKDNRTGVAKVYVDKSIDRGNSFGSDVNPHDWQLDGVAPWLPYTTTIKTNDGSVYLAWIVYSSEGMTDSNVMFAVSSDGATTFGTPVALNSIEGEAIITAPCIAIDYDIIHVSYSRRASPASYVYVVTSSDGGLSFSPPVQVNDGTTQAYTGGPKIVVDQNGTLHAVWTENRAGNGPQYLDIYYSSSTDDGQTFSHNIRVNDDTEIAPPDNHPHFSKGAQGTPTITIDSDNQVHVAWEDFRNFEDYTAYCRDTYYATLESDTQFSSNIRINTVDPQVTSVNNADPNMVIDRDDNLFLVYSDAPSGNNSHHYVFFVSAVSNADQKSTQCQ